MGFCLYCRSCLLKYPVIPDTAVLILILIVVLLQHQPFIYVQQYSSTSIMLTMVPATCSAFPGRFAFAHDRTLNKKRPANNPKSSKRSKARVSPTQTRGASAGNKGSPLGINEVAFKSLILRALESLHGELGAVGYLVDVLSWDPVSGEGRLRVNARCVMT